MNKTAFFGGSFDPIHKGHIALLRSVMEHTECDNALIVPAGVSPFKLDALPINDFHRLRMCKLATEKYDDISVCDLEIHMKKPSYTINTIMALKATRPLNHLHLVCGSDAFLGLEKWYKYTDILRLTTICTAVRDDEDTSSVQALAEKLHSKFGADIILCPFEKMDVSSTMIRELVQKDESIRHLVDLPVAEYISINHLYRK